MEGCGQTVTLHLCHSFRLTLYSSALAWCHSHRYSPWSASSIGPSHGLQFFQNYSRMSPFCEMQSFRSTRLLLLSSRLLCGFPSGYSLHQGTSIQCSSTGCRGIFALVPGNIPLLFLLWSWYLQICLWFFSLLQMVHGVFCPVLNMLSALLMVELWPVVGPLWRWPERLCLTWGQPLALFSQSHSCSLSATKTLPWQLIAALKKHNSDLIFILRFFCLFACFWHLFEPQWVQWLNKHSRTVWDVISRDLLLDSCFEFSSQKQLSHSIVVANTFG